MFFIAYYAILFATILHRYASVKCLGIKNVEFGLGIGPRIFSFKFRSDFFRVNLLPLGEYAKITDPDDEKDGEIKLKTLKKIAIVSLIEMATFSVVALALCYILSKNPIDVFSTLWIELLSGIGIGNGAVDFYTLVHSQLGDAFFYTIFSLAALNLLPLSGNPMGIALSIPFAKIFRNPFYELFSLMVQIAILIVVIISLIW